MKNMDSAGKFAPPPKLTVTNLTASPKTATVAPPVPKPPKPNRKPLKIILAVILTVILALGITVVSRAVNLSNKIFVGKKTTFFEKIADFFTTGSNPAQLAGAENGQLNILLLGIGGEGHDGPYLTDTMILAQIKIDTGQVVLTSIPRDYWIKAPSGDGYEKINAAFSDGYLQNHDWDEAGNYAIRQIQMLSGLDIPYFAVLDFSGFEKMINQVGGVDLTVDRTFTDYAYPADTGDGYLPPQTFTAGPQHMDGATALIFARSRHADGPEGSDFARSKRQEKVINAFKQKIQQLNIISGVSTINTLAGTFADHFHTNMDPAEIYSLYTLIKEKNTTSFTSTSLDPSTGIICPYTQPDSGAYTLIPCPGKTTTDIENFFQQSFTLGPVIDEAAKVYLIDTTPGKTLLDAAQTKLQSAGMAVSDIAYTGPALDQTVIYEVNPKPLSANFIKQNLNATEVNLPPPGVNIDSSKTDIIVLLGAK